MFISDGERERAHHLLPLTRSLEVEPLRLDEPIFTNRRNGIIFVIRIHEVLKNCVAFPVSIPQTKYCRFTEERYLPYDEISVLVVSKGRDATKQARSMGTQSKRNASLLTHWGLLSENRELCALPSAYPGRQIRTISRVGP
jgi:hypothetical protein